MLDKIIQALSLGTGRVLAVAIACSLALFLPNSATDALGLTQVIEKARPWIGGVFLVAIAILLAEGLSVPAEYFYRRGKEWLMIRGLAKRLKDLSDDEKAVLASYLLKNKKTQGFSVMDGVIGALVKQQILGRVTEFGHHAGFQYGVQPWAWSYLKKHPETVGLTEENIREHQT